MNRDYKDHIHRKDHINKNYRENKEYTNQRSEKDYKEYRDHRNLSEKNSNSFYQKKSFSENFGKNGLINLSDVFTRKLEFQAWLQEVKKKSLSDITSDNERKYLEEFIQQYNNSEFLSKKYYDIIKYQAKAIDKMLRKRKREMDKILANKDSKFIIRDETFVFDDEGQKEKEKKIMKELEQKKKLEEAIYTMNKSKAEAMKELDFKGNLMRHLYQTGDVAGAKDIYNQHFNKNAEKEKAERLPPIPVHNDEEE